VAAAPPLALALPIPLPPCCQTRGALFSSSPRASGRDSPPNGNNGGPSVKGPARCVALESFISPQPIRYRSLLWRQRHGGETTYPPLIPGIFDPGRELFLPGAARDGKRGRPLSVRRRRIDFYIVKSRPRRNNAPACLAFVSLITRPAPLMLR